jgi:hypothetical protein
MLLLVDMYRSSEFEALGFDFTIICGLITIFFFFLLFLIKVYDFIHVLLGSSGDLFQS